MFGIVRSEAQIVVLPKQDKVVMAVVVAMDGEIKVALLPTDLLPLPGNGVTVERHPDWGCLPFEYYIVHNK